MKISRGLRRLGPLLVGLLVLGLAAPGSIAATPRQSASQQIDDEGEECTEAVPAAVSIAGVLDDGRNVDLDVHVLLDGVPLERGKEVMARAATAYAPLNITLKSTFQEVNFPAQRTEPEFVGDDPAPTSDSQYMFTKSKEALGGKRPVNADVVYLLSSDRIPGTTAGVADCIGGVRYPNRAFAIGENDVDQETSDIPAFCCTWATAKIAAHEIAHLLGAHHHYANCAEGAPAAIEDRHLLTCTVMFNDIGAVNLRFSTLEAAVVRGHVLEFADRAPVPETPAPRPSSSASPTPYSRPSPSSSPSSEPTPQETTSPESDPVTYSRTVDLDINGRVAKGQVHAGEASVCSAGIKVTLERRSRGDWSKEDATVTREEGSFRFRLAGKGSYRATVAESTGRNDGRQYTCAAAASDPARRR